MDRVRENNDGVAYNIHRHSDILVSALIASGKNDRDYVFVVPVSGADLLAKIAVSPVTIRLRRDQQVYILLNYFDAHLLLIPSV